MLTAWFALTWFLMSGANSMRPTALQRTYCLFWMYIVSFVALAGVTVLENNFGISGGYFVIIYFGGIFCALLISYLELFTLPRKHIYAEKVASGDSWESETQQGGASIISSRPLTQDGDHPSRRPSRDALRQSEDDDANERTSLLRGDRQGTFSGGYGGTRGQNTDEDSTDEDETLHPSMPPPYPKEQSWSGYLPRWTWLFQLLILTVVPLILAGQVALLMTSSLYQTASDGSAVLTVYLFIAVLSTLLIAPITPFIHRFTYPLPTLLFLICVATTIYNLTAFPFSAESKLKVYFLQQVDLDTGINTVSLTGLMPFVKDIIKALPSAAGQDLACKSPDYTARAGLTKCEWHGIPPNVMDLPADIPPESGYKKWLNYKVSLVKNATNPNTARFTIHANNTRACRILFDRSVSDINVTGFTTDSRFPRVHKGKGSTSLRLWRREWEDKPWEVFVSWEDEEGKGRGLDGKVVCLWSDANRESTIPAFSEARAFMPVWSIPTKLSDGLVEGFKVFKV